MRTSAGPPPPSPAALLVDAVLAAAWRPEARDEAEALARGGGVDWDELAALAAAEWVAPMLAARIGEATWLPADIREGFQAARYSTAVFNALLFDALDDLLGALEASGIRPIVLKGPALVGDVYPSADPRPMGDLDLWVREDEAEAALGVLLAKGFRVLSSEAHAGSQLAFESEVTLESVEGPIRVVAEIHWALLDSPFYRHGLPHAWFRSSAIEVNLAGHPRTMLALGPEANLLYLAAHLVLHHTAGDQPHRLWLFDLAELIWRYGPVAGTSSLPEAVPSRPGSPDLSPRLDSAQARPVESAPQRLLDWDLVVRQAEACHLTLVMQDALAKLGAWRVPVPEAARAAIGRLTPSRVEAQVFDQLTGPSHRTGRRFLVDLATLPRWRDRLAFGWQQLLPSPRYMRERYGVRSSNGLAAAYLRRWWRGVARLR